MSQENFVNNGDGIEIFQDIRLATFNKHAPFKIKIIGVNQILFFDKELSKAIMTKTKLRNDFL